MNKTTKGYPPSVQTTAMESYMHNTVNYGKAKSSMRWALVNGIFSAILLYDIFHVCPLYSFWWNVVEYILVFVLIFNTLFHICQYCQRTSFLATVSVTPEQKTLIGIKNPNPYIAVATPKAQEQPEDTTVTPMNISAVSWLSGSSPGNYSMSATSWEYLPNVSRASLSPKTSPDHSQMSSKLDFSMFSHSSGVIDSEESLAKYLSEYEEYEKSLDQASSSVWKNSPGRFKMDHALLKGCTYQMSTPSPELKLTPSGEVPDKSYNIPSPLKGQLDIWTKLGVERHILVQWNSNLRRWISQTILERLGKEMETMDLAFQRAGLSDIRIGSVGLERLKKTVQMQQVAHNMPTFPSLVRFLELSNNQEYIVMRIKELAKGGCMSEFRWNAGGRLHGKEWDDHLPTDAALVMYLLATYLDTQLPPLPHNPEGQPFTSEYLVRAPNKMPLGKNIPVIQEVQIKPPHYVLHVQGDKMDVGKGRNNFFHTVLLFLCQLYEKEHGMIGRINMGPSGINILWVIGR